MNMANNIQGIPKIVKKRKFHQENVMNQIGMWIREIWSQVATEASNHDHSWILIACPPRAQEEQLILKVNLWALNRQYGVEVYHVTPNHLGSAHPTRVTRKANSLGTTPQKIFNQRNNMLVWGGPCLGDLFIKICILPFVFISIFIFSNLHN